MDKNARIRESFRATRVKRASQEPVTRELKLVNLNASQNEALIRVFLEAKWLYNHLVSTNSWGTWDSKSNTVPVRLPNGTFEERKLIRLGSQVKQSVVKQIESSIKVLSALKVKGRKVGALRPQRSYNGLQFIQHNVTWKLADKKLKLQGLPGWFRVLGIEQLEGLDLSAAKLVRRPSGYFLKVTGWREPEAPATLPEVGLDFGIKTHLTASDEREWNVTVREPERLKRLQRKLERQSKGSKNRGKTLMLLAREYEKLGHRKDDAANKIVNELKAHSRIVYQDESLNSWKVRYGKMLQHSVLGRVKSRLRYLPQAVQLDRWAPSTQLCPECGSLNRLPLSERAYSCACGYHAPRDRHAARNMLVLKSLTPEGLGGAPVDWRTAVASYASSKSRQVEAGNETAHKQSGSTSGEAAVETRLSSAVA